MGVGADFFTGDAMKTPDRLDCPCCGQQIPPEMPGVAVAAVCEQTEDNETGALVNCRLFWRCCVCGCRWLHGQYETKEEVKT